MSYNWDRIGTFESPEEAERWYRKANIDARDADIQPVANGWELKVRSDADAGRDLRPTKGFW